MKEIGGYFELERSTAPMLHEDALALSCGRACIEYLIEQKKIKKIALPVFLCDVVRESCLRCGCEISYYHVGTDFMPLDAKPEDGQRMYIVNYYGQLSREKLMELRREYPGMILDNSHDYFAPPLPDTDCIYTCRKFFGVPDGGFIYTDAPERELERDISYKRMEFVLGRLEKGAGEFYSLASDNNDFFSGQPVKRMSLLTENLLRCVDYKKAAERRNENFRRLHRALGEKNLLRLNVPCAPFAYPMMLENAAELRKELIANRIYVPFLWPNVPQEAEKGSTDCDLAEKILPLPCDQRYNAEDMDRIISFFN